MYEISMFSYETNFCVTHQKADLILESSVGVAMARAFENFVNLKTHSFDCTCLQEHFETFHKCQTWNLNSIETGTFQVSNFKFNTPGRFDSVPICHRGYPGRTVRYQDQLWIHAWLYLIWCQNRIKDRRLWDLISIHMVRFLNNLPIWSYVIMDITLQVTTLL